MALIVLVGILALSTGSFAGRQRPVAESPAGKPADDFCLRDFRGQPHALRDLADRKLVVVVFLTTGCPVARLYGPRLEALARQYAPHGVAFLGVSAGGNESLAELAHYARAHKITFPLLKDPDGALAERMGAERTPEAFILDERRVVRYRGRIDDQYGVGMQRPRPRRHDLAVALEELLAGQVVSRPRAKAAGCRIARRRAPRRGGGVTYSREVARILQRRCVECHRSGEPAPFPLTSYKEAKRWAAMMREVVEEGRMPPWFADPRHGTFRNDARLDAGEKQKLLAWIDDGCPEGDPADLPAPTVRVQGWRIPKPDRVLRMADRPYRVPATGELEYRYFTVDPGFKEDRYIRAAEVRPGNPAVVHHALVLLARPGEDDMGDPLGALIDYAPGMTPLVLGEGQAIHVPAGSKFVFQLHYTPNGSDQEDQTRLGLVFTDAKSVKRVVRGGAVVNPAIEIPPGARDHRMTAEHVVHEDALLLSLSPHLHLRGKAFRYEAVYPGGRSEVLLDVPRYDFNWQLRYELAEPKRLPRGTRLVCTARWDNSADNPANPDPTRTVGWGDQTSDEMFIGFFAYSPER
jgi:peroxiredoxin